MIDESVVAKLKDDLEYSEEILLTSRPKRFVYCYFDFLVVLGLSIWIAYAQQTGLDINLWGPCIIISSLIFLHGFYPNFEIYAISDRRVIIKRRWLLMASAYVDHFLPSKRVFPLEGYTIKKRKGIFGDVITLFKKAGKPSFWPGLEGSSFSFRFMFFERHWFNLFTSSETDEIYNLLQHLKSQTN